MTCVAACRALALIVTTSSCSSTACRPAPTRRRASSELWRLALRLAAHRLVTDKAGSAPVLVLDDVLSELDPARCEALLRHLPPGQVVLTTAGVLPEAAHPDAILRIEAGMVMS